MVATAIKARKIVERDAWSIANALFKGEELEKPI